MKSQGIQKENSGDSLLSEQEKLKELLTRPLVIAGRSIPRRLALAPMAGLGHLAFREYLSEFGGYGLLFTEMCSARALPHENPAVSEVFRWRKEELPHLVCQIVGNDPEEMARAAMRIEAEGFFGVDLNFGCSVAAICKQNAGAALLKNPDQALAIVKEVRKSVKIPLSVKFRTGWEDKPEQAVAFAKKLEDAGCDFLTFHPRVAPDRRTRPPRWEYIARVKEAIRIPLFGNGNVFTENCALRMFETTGCDGISLGRMAVAKPWIFALWTGELKTLPSTPDFLLHIYKVYVRHFGEIRGMRLFKKILPYVFSLYPFGHSMCIKIRSAENEGELAGHIREVFCEKPKALSYPNGNMII
ncbi:tRNA-dihydrouridine synthase family protein [Desulfococcaceae bacterium OttesenSCG-928-F15]|nr:tRNA-dihydrouridine synthase family protein [Desulfococcaceae bacterium OttesenSCG-928-F15]